MLGTCGLSSDDVSNTIERMLSGGPACFPDCCGNSSHEGTLPASLQQPELRSTVVQNLQSCMRKPLGFMGPAYGSRAFRGSLLCLNASCRLSRLTRMIRSSACHLSQHRLQAAHQPQGSLQTLTQDHPRQEALGFIDCLLFKVGIGGVALGTAPPSNSLY